MENTCSAAVEKGRGDTAEQHAMIDLVRGCTYRIELQPSRHSGVAVAALLTLPKLEEAAILMYCTQQRVEVGRMEASGGEPATGMHVTANWAAPSNPVYA